jgi:hypothetical protein
MERKSRSICRKTIMLEIEKRVVELLTAREVNDGTFGKINSHRNGINVSSVRVAGGGGGHRRKPDDPPPPREIELDKKLGIRSLKGLAAGAVGEQSLR